MERKPRRLFTREFKPEAVRLAAVDDVRTGTPALPLEAFEHRT